MMVFKIQVSNITFDREVFRKYYKNRNIRYLMITDISNLCQIKDPSLLQLFSKTKIL